MAVRDDGRGIGGAFSSAGRIGPARALVVTIAALVILKLVALALDRGGLVTYALAGGVAGATVAKLFAEWARRLHDTGVRASWGVMVGVLVAAAVALLTVSSLRDETPWVMRAAWIGIALILTVALLRPGTRGDNCFGPPPAGLFGVAGLSRAAGDRRGAIWAVVATIGGALIGYTLIDISDGMRAAQDRTRDYVEKEGGR